MLVAPLIVLVFVLINKSNPKDHTEVVQLQNSVSVHPCSDSDMKRFWQEELNDLIYLQLVESKLPYSEINDHFREYNKRINIRTGKKISVALSTSYHWSCKDAEGSGGINAKDGSVEIQLYIPAIMDLFEALEHLNQTGWREAFRAHCIILFMHEMEHVVKDTPMKKHIDIGEESRAWAETCRYTITPLVERYHLPLLSTDSNMYQAWKESGGNTNSDIWMNAIRKLYGDLDGKTN